MKALSLLVGLWVVISLSGAVSAPASLAPVPPATDLRQRLQELKPGQFLWNPQVSPQGPVTVVVSLTEQRAYVYRNGIAIGVSTISSGKKGKETPTGVFSILQKKVDHKSDLYNSAPMPYMQRLTWDGIALHAGHLPGYPASHGCVRLPIEFAKKLFETTGFSSTTVIVTDAHSAPVEVYHPGLLAPTVSAGKPVATAVLSSETFWNDPGDSGGPLSVLVSRADLRAYVFRGGQLVGSAPVLALDSNQQHHGMAVFSLLEKPIINELMPARPLHWSAIQVSNPEFGNSPREQLGSLNVDPDFLKNLQAAMDVGTTLVITDLASTAETRSNGNFTVITTEAEKTK
ncbi:lipoprotein-anchoring transpeptidase ErfK/SrfK [Pseudomonas sp. TE3786]